MIVLEDQEFMRGVHKVHLLMYDPNGIIGRITFKYLHRLAESFDWIKNTGSRGRAIYRKNGWYIDETRDIRKINGEIPAVIDSVQGI